MTLEGENISPEDKHKLSFEEIEELEYAVELLDYDPEDGMFLNKEQADLILKEYRERIETLQNKPKEEQPSNIQEFMLVMGNFLGHFKEGYLYDSLRELKHYKKALENEPDFEALAQKISYFANSEDGYKRTQPVEKIFIDEPEEKYQYLYKAYLLMRKYTDSSDLELYT